MGGGAWPFLVRGVSRLLDCDNERDLWGMGLGVLENWNLVKRVSKEWRQEKCQKWGTTEVILYLLIEKGGGWRLKVESKIFVLSFHS